MRLKSVQRGDGLGARFLFGLLRVVTGRPAPDVVRTLVYHKRFFGEHHARHTQAVMRGTSEWTIGERELFAAFVSKLNQCSF